MTRPDALAWSALRVEPAAGHAVHAQTHVFYETGQHIAGLEWLDPWIASSGQGASHRAHFSWHAALHELSMGDLEAVRRRYERELAPPHVTGVRALVDSASLLWRCRVTESWAGDLPLTSLLELVGSELLERPATPFTAMHSAVALAAAGDCAGLVRLRAFVAASPEPVMSDVVVSALRRVGGCARAALERGGPDPAAARPVAGAAGRLGRAARDRRGHAALCARRRRPL